MKNFYFHIVSGNVVVMSMLPVSMCSYADTCECGRRRYYSKILGNDIIEMKENTDDGYLYVCSDDKSIVNKELQYYLEALKAVSLSYRNRVSEIKNVSDNDFRRLKHNITDYNAKIKDDVDSFLSLERLQRFSRKDVEDVEDIVRKHSLETAFVLLRIYRNTMGIKSELIVHDLIKSNNPHLEIRSHQIHKVLKISFQPYFLELLEKKIIVCWKNCYEEVYIDYSSIYVALGHIWGNAVKYAHENSDIFVNFYTDENYVEVRIMMESLYIEASERERLTEECYSGKWAKEIGASGNGIGMYYIKKLTTMNGGMFDVERGDEKIYYENIPYAWNTFILKLKKTNEMNIY